MPLSPEDKRFYETEGYLVVERLFGPEQLRALTAAIRQLLAGARDLPRSNAVYDLGPGHSPERPQVRRIKDPHRQHPAFDAALRDPAILDIVAELLGGSVRFDHAKLNFKPAGGRAAIEWHQDWAFYPHTNDDLLAVGLMIEDCTPENGPLMVIPGSHKGRVFDHHQDGCFIGAIAPAELQDLLPKAVALTAPAGSVSFHHVRTIHGSRENSSASSRPLLLFSYAAVDAFPVFEKPDIAEFDSRILRGSPTTVARQTAVPVRIPEPKVPEADSIFDDQAIMRDKLLAAQIT